MSAVAMNNNFSLNHTSISISKPTPEVLNKEKSLQSGEEEEGQNIGYIFLSPVLKSGRVCVRMCKCSAKNWREMTCYGASLYLQLGGKCGRANR